MTRGEGITPLKRYKWKKQSNGKYSIFDVEIFRPFERETESGEEIELTPSEAGEVIANFQSDKNHGRYQRVHLEHQPQGTKNARGIGYLDNIRWDENRKEFFADLVEIEQEHFERFMNGDLPYRSVEYDFQNKKITGLAILESRPDYFNFTNLFLAQDEANVNELQYFQAERSKILQFGYQFCGKSCNCDKKLKFCDCEGTMDKDEKDKDVQFADAPTDTPPPAPETDGDEPSAEPSLSEVLSAVMAIGQKLDQLLQLDAGTPPDTNSDMATPSSVAMQADPRIAMLEARIAKFERQQAKTSALQKLKNLCDENPEISFEDHKQVLMQFQDESARNVYLQALPVIVAKPIGASASQFAAKRGTKMEAEIFKKYQTNAGTLQFAKAANKKYQQMLENDARNGKKTTITFFPTAEKFIDNAIEEEEIQAGFLERL